MAENGGNRMRKRNQAVIGVLAAALLGTGAAGTYSYLTSQEKMVNTFTVGDLDVDLDESEWDEEDEDGKNVLPGYSAYKNPTIKNITSSKNGEEPCYARVRVCIADASGKPIEDEEALALIKQTIRYDSSYTGGYQKKGTGTVLQEGRVPGYSLKELSALPMVNPKFALDETRSTKNTLYFSYMGADKTGILKIGEEAALFTAIAIPTDWTQTEMKKAGNFRLEVLAEAIQAFGFASQKEALEQLDADAKGAGV